MSTKHLVRTRKILQNFVERSNMTAIRQGTFKLWELRHTPTTISVRCNDEIKVSVSANGDLRFYDGVEIPGLENAARNEGDRAPKDTADFPRTKIGYHDVARGVPQWDTAPFVQFESVNVTESRKVPVEAIRKYGQMKAVVGVKYDKAIKPTVLGTGRALKIRTKPSGGSGWKAEIQKSAVSSTPAEVTEQPVFRKSHIKLTKSKMTKRMGKLVSRDAVARMEHKPCRVSL